MSIRSTVARRAAVFALLAAFLVAPALATTWGPEQTRCPVCGTALSMQAPMSSGSYIFKWPSKFQLVFWPRTASQSVWYCAHCHYAAFMGDFAKLPKEKVEAVRAALKGLAPPAGTGDYATLPMVPRLALAEAAYRVLAKDDAFFCEFHRVQGWWLAKEGKPEEATAARKKALALAEKLLAAKGEEPAPKELRYVVGAMRYLTGDVAGAKTALGAVAATPAGKLPKGAVSYLDELAAEALKLVAAGEPLPGD
jgi:hypothetical protein